MDADNFESRTVNSLECSNQISRKKRQVVQVDEEFDESSFNSKLKLCYTFRVIHCWCAV